MVSKLLNSNIASSSGSGTLPGNTVPNPKEDLKGITTRSGVAYQGPTISTPSKVVKQRTEVTKDQVQTLSSQSTAPVQPPVAQPETQTPVSEPVVAPVSASMPNLNSSIPYLSRRDNERRRDQANEQIEKFYEIFKEMSFEISFTDALTLMPKFSSTLKALIGNKEKLSEMARTTMNQHCSAVILNKLPKKLGDPDKFIKISLMVNLSHYGSNNLAKYMNESQYNTVQNLSVPALQDDLILSVIEQLKTQVEDEAGAEDWFFLSRSNALTKSLSSETSDEIAGVEELVLTLATTALARD
nr:reverse transcriptase domain-containing protein [Tanacetum cinerariifolium]